MAVFIEAYDKYHFQINMSLRIFTVYFRNLGHDLRDKFDLLKKRLLYAYFQEFHFCKKWLNPKLHLYVRISWLSFTTLSLYCIHKEGLA